MKRGPLPGGFRRLLRMPTSVGTLNREVADEIQFHLQSRTEELQQQGLSLAAAKERAASEYGDIEASRTELVALDYRQFRRRGLVEFLGSVCQDLRVATRTAARQRGFVSAIVLTIALGVGAATSTFSIAASVLLRRLPYPESDQLVRVVGVGRTGGAYATVSDAIATRLTASRAVRDLAGYDPYGEVKTFARPGGAMLVRTATVTPSFFQTFRVPFRSGRPFSPIEASAPNPSAVVLSHAFWQAVLAADPGVIGRLLILDDASYTVVGVADSAFRFPAQPTSSAAPGGIEPQILLAESPLDAPSATAGRRFLVGRLGPGTSAASLAAELTVTLKRSAATTLREDGVDQIGVVTLAEDLSEGPRTPLVMLLGAVAFVMCIVCINVASLFSAKARARQVEFAVRRALGADRTRLIRQLLTEGVLLALVGGLLGVGLSYATLETLLKLLPPLYRTTPPAAINTAVLLFSLGLSVLSGLVFAAGPAVQFSGVELMSAIKGSVWRPKRWFGRALLQNSLTTSQVAFAVILLTGTTLLLKSMMRVHQITLTYNPAHIVTLDVVLPPQRYGDAARANSYFDRLESEAEALAGRSNVAQTRFKPLGVASALTPIRASGASDPIAVDSRLVSPGYFGLLGMELRAGRTFTAAEGRPDRAIMAVINESAARLIWHGQAPLGRAAVLAEGRVVQVIGVVRDVRERGVTQAPAPTIYLPVAGAGNLRPRIRSILVRLEGGRQGDVSRKLVEMAGAIDPSVPVTVSRLDEMQARLISQPRFIAVLLGTFSLIALMLAAVGVAGLVAEHIAARERELALRIALGAVPGSLVRQVAMEEAIPLACGLVIGVCASLPLTRLLRAMLFDVAPTDPGSLAVVIAALSVSGILAIYIPARRVVGLDPAMVFRR